MRGQCGRAHSSDRRESRSKTLRRFASNWKGIVMGFTVHPRMRKLVLAATLAVGASGIARADDSSMNPFTGESYAAFNGGHNLSSNANPTFDQAPSAWHKANPDGLPERVFQSYSAPGLAWKVDNPVFAGVASDPTFNESHPGGLSESELQALSSDAP